MERKDCKDQIRGSLVGGAAGDALGYVIEFMSEGSIFGTYGPTGITEYQLDKKTGKALISDDTQMTLFTANGILLGNTRGCLRGIEGLPSGYVRYAYLEWLKTQTGYVRKKDEYQYAWLFDVPELHQCRAPGNTCLSALREEKQGSTKHRINHSKGCGGVMRVAPLGLFYDIDLDTLDQEGAEIAAITHGHSLGFMPAAILTHILNRILYAEPKMTLKEIVLDACRQISKLFDGDKHLPELISIIDKAIILSENSESDLDNIHQLGEGWVGEEALAIALYCSLKYQDDFSQAIIAAVNHKGDSDSTGAITGNIVGSICGYDAIHEKWKTNLELHDVILEIADDLTQGCLMEEYSDYRDPVWMQKYVLNHRYKE